MSTETNHARDNAHAWAQTIAYMVAALAYADPGCDDAMKEDLAIWDSVFPDLLPDRLKSDKQLAEEDVAAKIDAARLEGIRLGLEAAAAKVSYWHDAGQAIRRLDPETIAKETNND